MSLTPACGRRAPSQVTRPSPREGKGWAPAGIIGIHVVRQRRCTAARFAICMSLPVTRRIRLRRIPRRRA